MEKFESLLNKYDTPQKLRELIKQIQTTLNEYKNVLSSIVGEEIDSYNPHTEKRLKEEYAIDKADMSFLVGVLCQAQTKLSKMLAEEKDLDTAQPS